MMFMNYAPALFFLDKPNPLDLPAFAPFLAPFVGAGVRFCFSVSDLRVHPPLGVNAFFTRSRQEREEV